MKNQTLSIERMRHLRNLGVDTSKASMCWSKIIDGEFPKLIGSCYLISYDNKCQSNKSYEIIPVFTLIDIMNLLPRYINYNDISCALEISPGGECNSGWTVSYRACADIKFDTIHLTFSNNVINAAYKMLCWCAENGYLNNNQTK